MSIAFSTQSALDASHFFYTHMLLLLLKPNDTTDLITHQNNEHTHIVLDGPLGDPNSDYWAMYCGLTVRAYDDGRLDPSIDFYDSKYGHKASCPECHRRWINPKT